MADSGSKRNSVKIVVVVGNEENEPIHVSCLTLDTLGLS